MLSGTHGIVTVFDVVKGEAVSNGTSYTHKGFSVDVPNDIDTLTFYSKLMFHHSQIIRITVEI